MPRAPKTPVMRGYKKVPGSSRYYTPNGKEISRRQYDNRRLKKLGWSNRYQAEKYRETGAYNKWRHRLINAGRKPGELSIFSPLARSAYEIDIDRAEKEVARIRNSPDYEKPSRGRDNLRIENDPRLRDPEGPLSEMLEWLGFRDEEMTWDVGDTG